MGTQSTWGVLSRPRLRQQHDAFVGPVSPPGSLPALSVLRPHPPLPLTRRHHPSPLSYRVHPRSDPEGDQIPGWPVTLQWIVKRRGNGKKARRRRRRRWRRRRRRRWRRRGGGMVKGERFLKYKDSLPSYRILPSELPDLPVTSVS